MQVTVVSVGERFLVDENGNPCNMDTPGAVAKTMVTVQLGNGSKRFPDGPVNLFVEVPDAVSIGAEAKKFAKALPAKHAMEGLVLEVVE